MSTAHQHSDLLFDFGPRGQTGDAAPVDWVPKEVTTFDANIPPSIPTFTFSSLDPLPAPVVAPPSPPTPEPLPNAAKAPSGFWLNGDVVMCTCPDCRSPMSVRLWLMLAECWNCGTAVELNDELIREVERVLDKPAAIPATTIAPPPPPVSSVELANISPTILPPAPPPLKRPRVPREGEKGRKGEGEKRREGEGEKVVTPPALPVPPPAPTVATPPPAASVAPSPPPTPAPAVSRTRAEQPRRAAPRHVEPEEDSLDIFKVLFHDMPAWLLSFIMHVVLMMLLALTQYEHKDNGPWVMLTASVSPERKEGGEVRFTSQEDNAKFDLPLPKPDDLNDPKKREALLAANQDARQLRIDANDTSSHLPPIDAVRQRVAKADGVKQGLTARDPRLRVEMVKQEGGTTLTEASVARALRWFQRHQSEDGSWGLHDFNHVAKCSCGHRGGLNDDTAGTALALLPYLGAGQSHLVGAYKEEVAKGLRWLILKQKPNGDLRSTDGNSGMYAHGQATIVLCEAFAMTGDEELRVPAQKAVDFIVQAQYNDGGWRYTPSPRNQQGDLSVVGWQLMALQSARAANLTVPETTFQRTSAYLDRVQHNQGARYSYQAGGAATPAMTAEGLLCRLYLGWNKSEPALNVGVKHLLKESPPDRGRGNIYYWYYATQTFHHYGGQEWEEWNIKMRDLLVDTQQREGHAAGSWTPIGEHSEAGGRIYMTALSACTLEVYYRHLPIFRRIKVDP